MFELASVLAASVRFASQIKRRQAAGTLKLDTNMFPTGLNLLERQDENQLLTNRCGIGFCHSYSYAHDFARSDSVQIFA